MIAITPVTLPFLLAAGLARVETPRDRQIRELLEEVEAIRNPKPLPIVQEIQKLVDEFGGRLNGPNSINTVSNRARKSAKAKTGMRTKRR